MPAKEPPDPFENEPPYTDHQILRDLWYGLGEVIRDVKDINARVSKLERFMWMAAGAISVSIILVVPVLIDIILDNR